MIIPESEARTKWCPFAKALVAGQVVNRADRTGEMPRECRCLGRDCMLWIVPAGQNPNDLGSCGLANT